MNSTPSQAADRMLGKVLACLDESRYATPVCDYAAWSAQRMGAPLSLLHVIPHPPGGRADEARNLSGSIGFKAREGLLAELAALDARRARLAMEQGRILLEGAAERAREAGYDGSVEIRQRHGALVDAALALEPETRMLVLGKRGEDTAGERGHLGSQLEGVIRAIHHPVLIAQQTFSPPRRIMFAWDGSRTATRGLEMLARSPLFRGIPVDVVTAGENDERTRLSLAQAQGILEVGGYDVKTAVVGGEPANGLLAYREAHGVDLVIMGAYGHSRIRRFLVGSTTTALLSRCRVSMMVLR
jgi:nucleotide-binding universal stress UspA family protein